jgi:hypothetical protein
VFCSACYCSIMFMFSTCLGPSNFFMLKHIYFCLLQGEMKNAIHEDIWQEPEFVPTCLSMHFRSILLRRCRGRECELQFLQYIVRNSPGILSLSLHYDASLSIYTKFNMATQLARMCSPNPDFVRYLDI